MNVGVRYCASFSATRSLKIAAARFAVHPHPVVIALILTVVLVSSASSAQTEAAETGGEDVEQFIEELTEPSLPNTVLPVAPETPPSLPVEKPSPQERPKEPSATSPERRPVVAPPANSDSIVVVKSLSYEGLLERYDALVRARGSGDTAQEKRASVIFEEGLLELGLVGRRSMVQATDLAVASLVVARAARSEGRHDDANQALRLATELAPDLASVHLETLRVAISVIDPVSALESTADLVRAVFARPDTRVASALISLVVLVATWAILLLVIALLAALRAFRYFAFDVHNAMPRGIARWQIAAVLAVLLVMPIVAGLGPVLTALVWLLIFGAYLDARQRAVYGGVLVVVIALPLLLDGITRLADYPRSIAGRSHRALLDLHDDAERAELSREPQEELPVVALAALAENALREGRVDEAKELIRLVVSRANDSAWAHNNLGVVAAVEGKLDLADVAFKDALLRDPQLFEALFNRTLVAARGGNPKGVDVSAETLASINPDLNERLRRLTYRAADEKISQNRAYVLAAVPTPALVATVQTVNEASQARYQELADAFFLGMPARVAVVVFGVVFALFLLLGRLVKTLQPSVPCTRCGAPSGRRYDGQTVPAGTCSACYHAFVRKDGTLDAGMRVLKERQGATFKKQTRLLTRVAAVLVPGGGHHFAGAPARATAGTTVVVSLGGIALFAPTLMLLWPSLQFAGMEPIRLVAGALALVLHVVLVWDAFRMSE